MTTQPLPNSINLVFIIDTPATLSLSFHYGIKIILLVILWQTIVIVLSCHKIRTYLLLEDWDTDIENSYKATDTSSKYSDSDSISSDKKVNTQPVSRLGGDRIQSTPRLGRDRVWLKYTPEYQPLFFYK